jgi:hypothetical protein
MKVPRLLVALVLAAGLGACAVYVPAGGGAVYASVPPPLPRVEVVAASPGGAYVWTPGYWAWGAAAYHWTPGRWLLPPPGYRSWQPGYWERGPRGHHWTPGRWR